MSLAEDGTLYAVSRLEVDDAEIQAVTTYTSEDGWLTAALVNRVETTGAATTLTLRDGEVYYINAYLQDRARTSYEITRAIFE